MEYNGKNIKTLKELEETIVKDIDIRGLLDKLEDVPKQIQGLVSSQQSNLLRLREVIDVAEKLSDPTTKDNLLAVTKEMFQLQPGQDGIAELLLKQNKKSVIKQAKEGAMDGVELIKHIKSFYENIMKVDMFGAKSDGKAIAKKLKKLFGNGNLKTSTKKLGRNLGLSILLAALSSILLGFPIGSLEYFGITGAGSLAAGILTADKNKERISNLIGKIKKKK